MKIKVNVIKNSYLINGTITKIIKRVRKDKTWGSYDVVEVECNDWKDIRVIFFNGTVLVPEEFEKDEIVMWKHEKLDNSKNDTTMDIEFIRKLLNTATESIATHEVEDILMNLSECFELRVEKLQEQLNSGKEAKNGTIK